MRRNQLTITYPEGDAQQLHQVLLQLKKKQMAESLSILSCSNCRETGATGGSQVKTITIRLAALEAAMLVEIQKRNKDYRDIQSFFLCQIREEYRKELGLA